MGKWTNPARAEKLKKKLKTKAPRVVKAQKGSDDEWESCSDGSSEEDQPDQD